MRQIYVIGTLFILIMTWLLLTACTFERIEPASEPSILTVQEKARRHHDVELLFEVEGCKVYGFSAYGYTRTFAACPGSTSVAYKSGKHTQIRQDTPTAGKSE